MPQLASARKFGERCVVADRAKIKAKFKNRGNWMYWMGFARDRAAGTYRMFNPATRKVIRTRDVRFTKSASVKSTDDTPAVTILENKGQEDEEHQEKPARGKVIRLVSDDESASEEEMDDYGDSSDDDSMPPLYRRYSSSDDSDSSESDSESDESAHSIDDYRPITRKAYRQALANNNNNSTSNSSRARTERVRDRLRTRASARLGHSKKVVAAMKKLQVSYNPVADKIAQE